MPAPPPAPEFTPDEVDLIAALLEQRYVVPVALESAESELVLEGSGPEPTLCPSVYWTARGAHFVVCKLAEARFRGRYFYDDDELRGTGREDYDSLQHCVLALLRVQSDDERQRAGVRSGATGDDLPGGADSPRNG
jgi:hypothetical protein